MVKHVAAVTAEAPAAELFARLSRFETYPQIFSFLRNVERDDAGTIPNRRIAWRSADGSSPGGHITLEPEDDDSTVVTMTVEGAGPLSSAQVTHDLELYARTLQGLENAPAVPGNTPLEVD